MWCLRWLRRKRPHVEFCSGSISLTSSLPETFELGNIKYKSKLRSQTSVMPGTVPPTFITLQPKVSVTSEARGPQWTWTSGIWVDICRSYSVLLDPHLERPKTHRVCWDSWKCVDSAAKWSPVCEVTVAAWTINIQNNPEIWVRADHLVGIAEVVSLRRGEVKIRSHLLSSLFLRDMANSI